MESWEIQSNSMFDRRYMNNIKKWWFDIDKINFLLVIAIIVFGLMMTATSSPAIANKIGVDKFFFLKKQVVFAFLGLALLIFISFLSQEKIKILSFFGLLAVLLLLVAVLLFGSEAKGAKRWISAFGFSLQPSEFAKAFFIVLNAFLLDRFYYKKWQIKYGVSMALYLVISALLLLQPDLGMTLTFSAIWAAQLFAYGLPMAFIIVIGVLGAGGLIGAYFTFGHVQDRINRFFDVGQKNYQVERSIDAIVNGSFFGTGPGNGLVKNYIPDAHTDFIFAVIAEEFGLISCIAILIVLSYLITRIVKRAMEEEDMFIYLCLCGLLVQFAIQVIINIGVSLSLLPTKGMTLPFISYGGSSMLAMSICFGFILVFTKRKYHRRVDYGNLGMM